MMVRTYIKNFTGVLKITWAENMVKSCARVREKLWALSLEHR